MWTSVSEMIIEVQQILAKLNFHVLLSVDFSKLDDKFSVVAKFDS